MAPVLALPMITSDREPLLVVEPLTLYFARKQLTPPVGLRTEGQLVNVHATGGDF